MPVSPLNVRSVSMTTGPVIPIDAIDATSPPKVTEVPIREMAPKGEVLLPRLTTSIGLMPLLKSKMDYHCLP